MKHCCLFNVMIGVTAIQSKFDSNVLMASLCDQAQPSDPLSFTWPAWTAFGQTSMRPVNHFSSVQTGICKASTLLYLLIRVNPCKWLFLDVLEPIRPSDRFECFELLKALAVFAGSLEDRIRR